ncbi:RNA-directed DNA polymerase [Streptococcus sp. S784/96/1]|uniref:RNA-directed DNA polymerase n=1 Tax=Streptococcus sp. S784/96/1 TaxID=2653499 RepID=UPI001389CABC|nr:RNA-directed DNA polymerase [Streptococcus sp. S784/96/1]
MGISKEKLKESCRRAIANVLYEGTTDVEIFNHAFEIDFLKNQDIKNEMVSLVCSSIQAALGIESLGNSGSQEKNNFSKLKVHKLGHVLVPKKNLSDYRKCAIVDIYDEIVYLTLVLSIAQQIENMRIKKSLNKVFSYRFVNGNKSGILFDKKYNYSTFRNAILKKSRKEEYKVVVECDIANFYDRLNIHRVESVLRSNPKIDEDIIYIINELLLYWANRDSYGLPVGSNASRILAESALIEVDNYLISKKIEFCRFVDDYRIFAKDAIEAHNNLALLTARLSKEGIFLNTQKTRVRDISEFKIELSTIEEIESNSHRQDLEQDNETKSIQEKDKVSKIIKGYSGLIPTKFRRLSNKEIKKLKENDLENMLNKATQSVLVDEKMMTSIIRTIVAREEYERLGELPNILQKYPQFIPYFVDTVLKCEGISKEVIQKICNDFEYWMTNLDAPEYIQVYLTRLYSTPPFDNKQILLNSFRNLKRNSGDYIGRAILEGLDGSLTRGELLEIRDYYYRADKWEERQILKMINSNLSKGEKRPFFKDIKFHEEDFFINKIISSKK